MAIARSVVNLSPRFRNQINIGDPGFDVDLFFKVFIKDIILYIRIRCQETSYTSIDFLFYTFMPGGIEGKTVGELIKDQRNIAAEAEAKENEAKRLAEEEKHKKMKIVAELSQHIAVAPIEKVFYKADFQNRIYHDVIEVVFIFENKGSRDIKAFKGEAIFKDAFGEAIKTSNLVYDGGIKAGQRKKWYGDIRYNRFMNDQVRFKNTELENMKFEWRPEAIIFSDGSRMGLDN